MAHARKSMNVIHRCKLNHVEFTLATGNLFDAQVDAIVSSEQTDFVLSRNPQSLSGQIWHRYGDAVQREGLFERWQKNALRYLVPETGEIFKAPRSSAIRDI